VRLFVAVDITDEVRAAAANAVDGLRRAAASGSGARVGWVAPDRMHITLEFIGDVSDPVGADIVGRLGAPFADAPFTLEFGGVGLFPPSGRPRVVWLGLLQGRAELQQLRAEVVTRLDGVPYRREHRPFSPHLTLGRFKEDGNVRDRQLLGAVPVPTLGACTVDRITVYQSRLSPKGPTYTPLSHAALAGSRG
jgi:RNA 2',3'-cyclic 3'-phosphodiesterase